MVCNVHLEYQYFNNQNSIIEFLNSIFKILSYRKWSVSSIKELPVPFHHSTLRIELFIEIPDALAHPH